MVAGHRRRRRPALDRGDRDHGLDGRRRRSAVRRCSSTRPRRSVRRARGHQRRELAGDGRRHARRNVPRHASRRPRHAGRWMGSHRELRGAVRARRGGEGAPLRRGEGRGDRANRFTREGARAGRDPRQRRGSDPDPHRQGGHALDPRRSGRQDGEVHPRPPARDARGRCPTRRVPRIGREPLCDGGRRSRSPAGRRPDRWTSVAAWPSSGAIRPPSS